MSLRVFTMDQGTDEWHDARRGMVTASVVKQLVSTNAASPLAVDCPTCSAPKGGPCLSMAARKTPTSIKTFHDARTSDASRLPPVYEAVKGMELRRIVNVLAAERITGYTEPTFISSDMLRGWDDEDRAREKYAEHHAPVSQVGLVVRDDWGYEIGCSPDGLVGTDGGLEIKSRRQHVHLATILADAVPTENMAQIQTCLLVTGRKWWDYVSYCGGMPLWVKRVLPDPAWHTAIVAAVAAFEKAAEQVVSDYLTAVEGLPMTERIVEMEMFL